MNILISLENKLLREESALKNKKGIWAGGVAAVLYALVNVIVQKELTGDRKPNAEVVNAYFYLWSIVLMLFIAVPIALRLKWIQFSSVPEYRWHEYIILCLLLEAAADYLVILAYEKNTPVAVLTTVVGFFPVFAVLIDCVWSGNLPSPRQLLGCALVPIAVYMVKPSF